MDIERAIQCAESYKNIFAPACDRIEIVGSTKRQDKTDVHDIELLMILNGKAPRPVFGTKPADVMPTMLDQILHDLQKSGILRTPQRKANGEKYKKFAIVSESQLNDFCLDLFIVTPRTWGIQNVIRTGPGVFSHCFVTSVGALATDHQTGKRYHGLLPAPYQYIKGETKIMDGDIELNLPEEADAIKLLGKGWIEPRDRMKLVREYVA